MPSRLANSTAHCVKYLSKKNICLLERFFWVFVLSIFLGLTTTVSLVLYSRFASRPTQIIVKDTHHHLANYPFPAVTICAGDRLNQSIALEYMSRSVDTKNSKAKILSYQLLQALSVMKYPTYFAMINHLRAADNFFQKFKHLNISDLMIKSKLTCEEIMDECYWHGRKINCCSIFSLQRTEQGFCYSFNSLTSDTKNFCLFTEGNCSPRHITSSGGFSGLTILIQRGVFVILSTSSEFPTAGTAYFEPSPGATLEIEVSPVIVESSSKLKRLSIDERQCLLQNERMLDFSKVYSRSNCQLECRHKYMIKHCNCQPYFFHNFSSSAPSCSMEQLKCISKQYGIKIPEDCDCVIPCHGTFYDLTIKHNILTWLNGRKQTGLIDIYFSRLGAVRYVRKPSFTREQLLVSIGGVANLFIGASLVSVGELFYYLIENIYHNLKMRYRKKKVFPFFN